MGTLNKDFLGFNTVNHSNLPRREEKARRQRMAILTTFAILALMIILAIAILISSVAGGKGSGTVPPSGNPSGSEEVTDAATMGEPAGDIEYTTVTLSSSDVTFGDLVLVNSTHSYVFPKEETHLATIYDQYAKHTGTKPYNLGISEFMDGDALIAMDKLLTDFHAATGNSKVEISTAYRTYEDQEKLTSSPIKAGQSDHHTGLGCSLTVLLPTGSKTDLSSDPVYNWISDNAHKYGFVVRYPENKSELTGVDGYTNYFRYVGIPHATYMKNHNICLEEYIELLKEYTYDGDHLSILGADGKTYEVYHVEARGSSVVNVPSNYTYFISGTNDGGVIVTVATN